MNRRSERPGRLTGKRNHIGFHYEGHGGQIPHRLRLDLSSNGRAISMIDEQSTEAVLSDIWTRLVRARHDRKADWRWFTVATSASDGTPRARTVVLRGCAPGQRRLDFRTRQALGQICRNRRGPPCRASFPGSPRCHAGSHARPRRIPERDRCGRNLGSFTRIHASRV